MTTSSASAAPQIVVGIGEVKLIKGEVGLITTHALGSCIGVTVFDPVARIAGMLHYLLPQPIGSDPVPSAKVGTYATTGLPDLFRRAYELGASKERLVVCAVGAANLLNDAAGFQIGARNRTMMRKLFWKNNITLAAEDTGGHIARTLRLSVDDGTVIVLNKGKERVLWQP